jgi:uncharacterized protein YdaT
MPWDAHSIRKHNKALKGAKAKKTAAVANAVLRETGDEGKALRIANSQAKKLYPKHH